MVNRLLMMALGTAREGTGCVPREHEGNSLQQFRKRHIERALDAVNHDLTEAAVVLDISVEELRHWMRKLEIPVGVGASGLNAP